MAIVLGDADHLLGLPIVGKPSEGQFYVYNGQAFVPANAAHQQLIENIQQDLASINQKSLEAFEEVFQIQQFLNDLLRDNTINIPEISTSAFRSLTQNLHLLWLRESFINGLYSGAMVDGFYENFLDDSFIDWTLSQAQRNESSDAYTSIESVSNLELSTQLDDPTMLILESLNISEMFWIQDNECEGHFEAQEKFFTYGPMSSVNPGKVSFPAIGHELAPGQMARFSGFNHPGYNTIHVIDPSSTENEIVISTEFYPEQITINCSYRKVLSLESSGECPGIVEGVKVQFANETSGIVWIDSVTKGAGVSKVALERPVTSQEVVGITGLDVSAEGVKISSLVDGDGRRNLSVTDAVPPQINSDNVYFSSETATYEAFKVFNDDFGANRRWLTAVNNTTGWVTYDFGPDKKIINKYRWRTFETDSNAVPGLWSLDASDNNVNWITLHSASNSVQTANTWIPQESPGYFTFINSQPFRYYRFHVTQNCGHPQYLCVEEIELIAAPEPICPLDVMFVYTRPEIVGDTTDWGEIESVHITENKPEGCSIYYAVSFDGAKSWSVYQNDAWIKVVTLESDQWKFRNAEGVWEAVNDNYIFSAFRRSLEEAQNWMSSVQIASLNINEWSQTGAWDNELRQIQFVAALYASGQPATGISAIELQYSSRAKGMRLVSLPKTMNPYAKNICASLLIKNMHESVRLYVSTLEPPSWIDCGVVQKRASLQEGIDFYGADGIQTHENAVLRLKAECESSHNVQFYGWAVSYY